MDIMDDALFRIGLRVKSKKKGGYIVPAKTILVITSLVC